MLRREAGAREADEGLDAGKGKYQAKGKDRGLGTAGDREIADVQGRRVNGGDAAAAGGRRPHGLGRGPGTRGAPGTGGQLPPPGTGPSGAGKARRGRGHIGQRGGEAGGRQPRAQPAAGTRDCALATAEGGEGGASAAGAPAPSRPGARAGSSRCSSLLLFSTGSLRLCPLRCSSLVLLHRVSQALSLVLVPFLQGGAAPPAASAPLAPSSPHLRSLALIPARRPLPGSSAAAALLFPITWAFLKHLLYRAHAPQKTV